MAENYESFCITLFDKISRNYSLIIITAATSDPVPLPDHGSNQNENTQTTLVSSEKNFRAIPPQFPSASLSYTSTTINFGSVPVKNYEVPKMSVMTHNFVLFIAKGQRAQK